MLPLLVMMMMMMMMMISGDGVASLCSRHVIRRVKGRISKQARGGVLRQNVSLTSVTSYRIVHSLGQQLQSRPAALLTRVVLLEGPRRDVLPSASQGR